MLIFYSKTIREYCLGNPALKIIVLMSGVKWHQLKSFIIRKLGTKHQSKSEELLVVL